ncbi:MAG: hypothetical protein EPGJADBJ_02178 [Saprospiraceae bacterium]|nr:hypothetical protein [Saprospiraceae bacterium]
MTLRLLTLLLLLWNINLSAQLIYYVRPTNPNDPFQPYTKFDFGVIDVNTCKDSTIFPIKSNDTLKYSIDIAVCPDGNFYLAGDASGLTGLGRTLGKLNLQDSTIEFIAEIPVPVINSLTCDANGVLYGGNSWNLFTYDTKTGVIDTLGFLGHPLAGDLTFRNNKLYGTTGYNELLEIDTANPSASQVVFKYPLPNTYQALGVVSDAKSCDSTTTYITVTNAQSPGITDTINEIYKIDPVAQTVTFVCETKGIIFGACSPTEFLASDCSVRLDLDEDDSSGAPDSNYLALPLCSGSTLTAAADTDATFYSGYRVDSVSARLLPPAPDAPLEYLTAQASGSVSVSGQGSAWLTLQTVANTAVPAANADFQAVLRSLQWHDDYAPFTPGPRTVQVVAYASNGLTDTAYAFVPVPQPLSAGRDTALALCADAPPFDLTALLATDASPGGAWSPQTAAGNSVFSPQNDAPGAYNYLVANGLCPADTATVSVNVLPLPLFSLGADTAFCAGETLTLTAPGAALWHDGTSAATYAVDQSGLFWAEIADLNGCRWRDSISVTVNQPSVSQLFATSCFGKAYAWNGQSFAADTSVCATYSAANGCDSMDCLKLTFFYPALSLDTSVCSGKTLTWLGQTFSQPGTYFDTLLYDGCLHAVTVNLAVQPPDTVQVAATICPGESYTLGGQTFSAAGQYAVPLASATGCDSLALLSLTVQQPVQSEIAAGICPGGSYVFGNQTLVAPGIYQDTFGCDSTVTLTLSLLPAPQPQITGVAKVCQGATATLSAPGNFAAWAWSGGESGATVSLPAGEHSVTVTDANGCRGADTVFVAEVPPIAAVWDTASPLCHGGSDGFIELAGISGGIEPFVFQLNNGATSDSAFFQNLAAGIWEVTVTDSAGCETVFSFELHDPPALAVDLGDEQLLKEGESYLISVQINQSGGFVYDWSPPQGLSCADCSNPVATPLETTTYTLFLENGNGCSASDSVTLRVQAAEPQVYAPNIFSPNDDSMNDFFTLFGNAEDFTHIELLQIFDRWGGLMFEGKALSLNDEQRGWDGTWRGKKMPPGVYTWLAEIRQADGALMKKEGEVTVLR